MRKILTLLICIGLIGACHHPEEGKKLSPKEMNRIFQNRYGSNPLFSYHWNRQKLLFLQKETVAERYHNFQAIVLEKNGKQWTETANTEIAEGYSLDSLSVVTIGHKEFLYAEADQGGGSMGNHSFTFILYDIGSDKTYSIEYEDFPEGGIIKTKLTKSKNLFSHLSIQRYLQHRIKHSERIFKPDAQELLVRRFVKVNKSKLEKLDNPEYNNKPVRFRSVTTKERLFSVHPVGNSGDNNASIVSSAENDNYIVVTWFKGPVLGYCQLTGDYFCVYVPPLMDGYIPWIEFNQAGNLVFKHKEGGKAFCEIYLDELIYTKL